MRNDPAYTFLVRAIIGTAGRLPPTLSSRRDGGVRGERRVAAPLHLRPFPDIRALRDAISRGVLVPVPASGRGYVLDPAIGALAGRDAAYFRYARPATRHFIKWFAGAISRSSGVAFTVTSLVRTTAYQRLLRRGNGNVAQGTSSHEFGTTVDFSKLGVGARTLACARAILLRLESRGSLLATEERVQSVFHVMVLPTFHPLDEPVPAACRN